MRFIPRITRDSPHRYVLVNSAKRSHSLPEPREETTGRTGNLRGSLFLSRRLILRIGPGCQALVGDVLVQAKGLEVLLESVRKPQKSLVSFG